MEEASKVSEFEEIVALIVAAGSGERARKDGAPPKQFTMIGGRSVLQRAVDAFAQCRRVTQIHVVIAPGQEALCEAALITPEAVAAIHIGGATRQESVRRGLAALTARPGDKVLIHDAARPFVSKALIDRVIDALETHEAAIPALPVTDTLKRVAGDSVVGTVSRDALQAAQTPQGFLHGAIREAHENAARDEQAFTDDAAVAEWAGMRVVTVPGDRTNIKLTTADDLAEANAGALAALPDIRVGFGFDVHQFGPGSEVWLGGVAIPHTHGLAGHSDADVILHALTDAILGALGDGDIGQHFPPSDERWKGAASSVFLADAVARVSARGGVIANLDITYVGEAPRLTPHRDAIRARIAEIAGISVGRVGVKATTNEKLGFIGRAEGAVAHAVATIRLPLSD